MSLLEFIFWLSAFWIVYVYLGYPLLAKILSRVLNCSVEKSDITPSVTVVIAAYNEAESIVQTVRNKIAQDYPPEFLSVIVVSDGSEDGTDELVAEISDARVKLIRQTPRAGKTSALNQALSKVDSEIVVFSDANSHYEDDAIMKLVRNFSDASVGYVTGKMVYESLLKNAVGDGCTAYMRFENRLREWETLTGSIVGADGGIDAVRACLYQPMRDDQLPDFVLPLSVREQGFRVVFEHEAIVKEAANTDEDSEFRMRVRVSLRALWAMRDKKALLNPFKFGLFSFQLLSHKLLRYLAVIPLVALFGSSVLLAGQSPIALAALIAQVLVYVVAMSSIIVSVDASWQSIPKYFVLLNLACGLALVKFLLGKKQVIWQPRN